MSNNPQRYGHIDALRAIAVTIVVLSHAGLGNIIPGSSGVTIFFVISGFIITHVLLREYDKYSKFDMREFYVKRLLKLMPPLVVIIIIPSIILGFFGNVSYLGLLSQIFFVFNWTQIYGGLDVLPGSGVTWSLAIEEQFYLVFAPIWILIIRFHRRILLTSIVAFSAIVDSIAARFFIVLTVDSYQDRIYYGTDTRIDGIAIGILFALLYRATSGNNNHGMMVSILRSPWCIVGSFALFIIATLLPGEEYRYTLRFTLQALSIGIILLSGMAGGESRLSTFIQYFSTLSLVRYLGLSSYSIYLVHLPVFELFDFMFNDPESDLFIYLKVLIGLSFGLLIWALVEQPFERFKNRIFKR